MDVTQSREVGSHLINGLLNHLEPFHDCIVIFVGTFEKYKAK